MAVTDAGNKPQNNIYTGLLGMSLLALVIGAALLAMDLNDFDKPPAKFAVNVPGAKAAAAK